MGKCGARRGLELEGSRSEGKGSGGRGWVQSCKQSIALGLVVREL